MLRGAERASYWSSTKALCSAIVSVAVRFVVVAAISVMVFVVTPGSCQTVAPAAEIPTTFDIPPQPLASALERYGDVTGREVFYDTALAQGRRTDGVKGVFLPRVALELLLDGTGLSARFMADSSFVLLPVSPSGRDAAPSAAHRQYYARIQESLRRAFCRSGDVRPGDYRVVALFWIGPSGDIQRLQRLGSVGKPDLDRGIDSTLHSVRFDGPPPAGFDQPVLIMIVPQGAGVTMGCEPGDQRIRSLESGR